MNVWVLTYVDDNETFEVVGVFSTLAAAQAHAGRQFRPDIKWEWAGPDEREHWSATVSHGCWLGIDPRYVQTGRGT